MAIEIKTPQDFIALANLTDEERGTTDNLITINITADLDFKGIDDMESFPRICGYVNGNGHTIKNIVLSKTSWFALFDFSGGGISGLTFENCNITVTGADVYLINATTNSTTFEASEIIVKGSCSFISSSTTAFCSCYSDNVYTFDKIIVSGIWNGKNVYGFLCKKGGIAHYRHIGLAMNVTTSGSSQDYFGILDDSGRNLPCFVV